MIVLKTPFSKGSLGKNISAEKAPDSILEQAKDIYLNESGRVTQIQVDSIEVNQENIAETHSNVMEKISSLDFSKRVCMLGGDHSLTFPAFRAFKKRFPDAGLIILDAHPDCESATDHPSHEDFVTKLVRDGIIEKDRLILFGLRSFTGNEKRFLDENRVRYFTMKQISMQNFSDVLDGITETISSWPDIYLSIDIDVADPSCAPGTGYIEPGGLTARQLISLVQRISLMKNMKMADIVEVGPDQDMNSMTSKLAAKLMKELG
ncbi:arginase family protein [Candidatus Woesearchaeota archaeon]|nr:arginase family protein [Candidatus Woesearchaeota archaeon]